MSGILPTVKVGDIGTIFDITVVEPADPLVPDGTKRAVNLTGYNTFNFEFEKPNGRKLTAVTATVKNGSGTDGILTYVDNVGIFDTNRRWKVRPILNKTDGTKFHGTWIGFTVGD